MEGINGRDGVNGVCVCVCVCVCVLCVKFNSLHK